MVQLWPHFESCWLFKPTGGSLDVVHLIHVLPIWCWSLMISVQTQARLNRFHFYVWPIFSITCLLVMCHMQHFFYLKWSFANLNKLAIFKQSMQWWRIKKNDFIFWLTPISNFILLTKYDIKVSVNGLKK